MSQTLDTQLLLALAIVLVAVGVFVAHLVLTTRRVGHLMSESKVPRRYLLLGLALGLGLIYMTRR
mgnify:CR=1 FL=1